MVYADLHLHTTASDGTLSPGQLVKLAREKGFAAIAITDHDTTTGLEEALATAAAVDIEMIPGIELSTLDGDREIHVLGYYPDPKSSVLQKMLSEMIEARQTRAVKMVLKLQKNDIDIQIERVQEIAGGSYLGRPHIAQALLEKGYIKELAEAFTEKFIGRGGLGYVERYKISPAEGIDVLKRAGAIPVLAHPGFLSKGEPVSEQEIAALAGAGLLGIEAYYSRHTAEQTDRYKKIAERFNLLITGGSDCHGQENAVNCLGSIILPYNYVEALKKMKEQQG